ncbi:MAG TPA: aminotransferase class V-fold PLP-dependent enzyme [Acidimicrobiales bacterium]|jgi:cysteine desulfurase|nr:aminotransferase class V-fold PLP-dependent enzyme [Acidimicrobiales bacterium]
MTEQYYFDHAASAPRRDEVSDAMAPWQRGVVGNPSGSHRAAREARKAVEEARDVVADFVGAKPGGVIFTAGGTESCHLAIVGATNHHRRTNDHSEIVISKIEHHAVSDAAEMMARDYDDVSVRYVDVDAEGVVDLDSLHGVLSDATAIVSVMAVNNETGIRQPLDGVNALAKTVIANGVTTHTDAVAAAPWLSLPTITATSDMISICAHKLGGPVNAGALVLRGDVGLDAVTPGGGQERGRRGGTVDVAAVVGLAAALRVTKVELEDVTDRVLDYQHKLTAALSFLPGCAITAPGATRVAGTVHVTFDGLASDELLFLLDQEGVCASAAASCSSGAATQSHVLEAMGVSPERARGSVRFSMGAETTDGDVDALIGILSSVVYRLRAEA